MHSVLEILEEPTGSSSDLISLSDLKFALGITGTSEDIALQAAITFQSRIITEYLDRERLAFASLAHETFTFDWREGLRTREALVLSLYPVVEIFEVSTLGATQGDFEFDADSGRLWLWPQSVWGYGSPYWAPLGPLGPFGQGKVTISYSGGYVLPDQSPARLQRAVIECVGAVRTSSGSVRDPTIREVQHGDMRVSYVSPAFASGAISTGSHLSPSVADLIQPYRRFYIA